MPWSSTNHESQHSYPVLQSHDPNCNTVILNHNHTIPYPQSHNTQIKSHDPQPSNMITFLNHNHMILIHNHTTPHHNNMILNPDHMTIDHDHSVFSHTDVETGEHRVKDYSQELWLTGACVQLNQGEISESSQH